MKRRIVICLGLLLIVCVLGDVVATLCLRRSITQLQELAKGHRIQTMRATLSADSLRVQTDLLSWLAGHEHNLEQRKENARRFTSSLRRCGTCHHPPHLQAEFNTIRKSFDAYNEVASLLFEGINPHLQPERESEAIKYADRFVEHATELSDRAAKHLAINSTVVSASIHTAGLVLYSSLLALLVSGGLVAFHLKARLTRPVDALVEGIQRVGEGNLKFRFPVYADDEFHLIAEAFNKANDDLQHIQDKILQTERLTAVGKFAAGVAHEVLNPLASVSSIAQLMRRRSISDEQAKEIDLIMKEISRISVVLRELLTFSRATTEEEMSHTDIRTVLDHAVTMVAYDPRARKVSINNCYDSDLPVVYGNSDKLLHVFTNIMLNALDALDGIRNDSGLLSIKARKQQDRIVLEFQDNGPGMTPEQIAHAFEPFYTTKDPGEGTGLGLWISYQVIKRHGGEIRIESHPDEGTKLVVELSCTPPDVSK